MREIKFRGKTLEDRGMLPAGSWIKGGYYVDYCYGGCPEGKHYIVTWNSTGLGFVDLIQVDPETVGQYTGIKDKNGKEIWEGDILHHKWHSGYEQIEETVSEVKWRNGAFVVDDKKRADWLLSIHSLAEHWASVEIIGNIHDNPDLLEG